MTEEANKSTGQPTWLIIAAVIISVSSLICCGCLAVAWIVGDVFIGILNEISNLLQLLPV